MRKWSHLELNPTHKYDWKSSLLTRTLPPRALYNELTKNIILSMQLILVKGFETADSIKTYFRL